ncbi:MAG: SLBB domain-containing protein [Phormidium sp.]
MFLTLVNRRIYLRAIAFFLSTLIIVTMAAPSIAQRTNRPKVKPVATEEPYLLGAGDKIRIDNADLPQQSGEYVIPIGGSLNLPLIGNLSVLGLTIEQADRKITAAYARELKQPEIAIRLVEPRPLNIVVSGEINKPGTYTIPVIGREPGIRYPTVSQVIQQAEGITQTADITRIQVRRRRAGNERIININLKAFFQTGDRNQDITLRDEDTIVIPTATNINLSQARQLATTSIATDLNKPRTITILGEVTRPGTYVVLGGNTEIERTTAGLPTVTRAIQLAGGITVQADIRNIQVRRTTKTGQQRNFNINLWQFLQTGDTNQNLIVQDGDIIFIPTGTAFNEQQIRQLINTNFAADLTKPLTVSVVGEVTRPGPYVVIGGDTQIDRLTAGLPTVTRAIQLAGGITQQADVRNIQLRRLTKAGGERIFNINLWEFLQTGDTNQNLVLQDGDTILIPTVTAFNSTEARLLNNTSFATDLSKPKTVTVVGEVNRPGTYVVTGGNTQAELVVGGLPTVTRGIQLAGGITSQADIRNIQVRRSIRTGEEQVVNINLWQLIKSGDFNQDLIVQNGDMIVIPTATDVNPTEATDLAAASFAPSSIQVSVVGEVGRPGQLQVKPDTTLNQAVLAAGGFNRNRAKRSSVNLIRLNSNGTVTQRTVQINFNQGINEETNPQLRNNDIIVVGRSGLARVGDSLDAVFGQGGLFSVFRVLEILRLIP